MLAGVVVVHVGHGVAALILAAVAAAGLLVFLLAMPDSNTQERAGQADGGPGERSIGAADAASGEVAAE